MERKNTLMLVLRNTADDVVQIKILTYSVTETARVRGSPIQQAGIPAF